VLIAEVCEADPYVSGIVSGDDQTGPLLIVLSSRHFDEIVLLTNDRDPELGESLVDEIRRRNPDIEIRVENQDPFDLASHRKAFDTLQGLIDDIRSGNPNAHIYAALNSRNLGTEIAWIRLVYHNPGITLIQLNPTHHPTSAPPEIDVIEESLPVGSPAMMLREPVEPMSDETARDMDLIGDNPTFRKALDLAYEIALLDAPTLIVGEPGSGKTSVASYIWRQGSRAHGHMQTADPAGLPDPLATALLFGIADKPGKNMGLLASGNGEILLIENVEKLCEPIQKALADYLKTGLFTPVGAKNPVQADTRLIFTSCDVSAEGPAGLVPELRDILRPTTIRLPSLRERPEDIPLIALHYLRRINLSLRKARSMPREMLRAMQEYQWSGNVRELRLAIERAALLSPGGDMHVEDLSIEIDRAQILAQGISSKTPEIGGGFSLENYLSEMRRKIILRALELSKGNQSEAARMLHITPQAVHQFLKFQNKGGRGKTAAQD
jgi:DNA-binding NtrC family response regulator